MGGREGGIEVVDVGLVMFLVVKFHDLLGDDRFKSLKGKVSCFRLFL